MQKQYERVQIQLILCGADDVVTTSGQYIDVSELWGDFDNPFMGS